MLREKTESYLHPSLVAQVLEKSTGISTRVFLVPIAHCQPDTKKLQTRN